MHALYHSYVRMHRMKHHYKAVLFDLDGTLIDTEHSAAIAVQNCFRSWQIQIQLEDISYATGRTWESAFTYLFEKYKIPVSQDEAKHQIMAQYRKDLNENLQTVPGGAAAVQSLSKEFKLALVSGSSRQDILWALDKLKIREHFQVILGAEDYPRSKPSPDGYQKAIQSFQVQPHECIVFEDSSAGISSARQAGTWVVAITSTNHFQQDITQAHLQIPDLRPVNPSWIRHLSLE